MEEERDITNDEERLNTADLAHPRRDVSREEERVKEFPSEGPGSVRLGTKPVLEAARGADPLSNMHIQKDSGGNVGASPVGIGAPDVNPQSTTPTGRSSTGSATEASATGLVASRAIDATVGAPISHAGSGAGTAAATARAIETGPLFSPDETKSFRDRWDGIQVGFVDEPRRSVEQADGLVASAMQRLAEQFSEERSRLEQQWIHGGDVSTEDLRLALRRYRSFFGRLLSV